MMKWVFALLFFLSADIALAGPPFTRIQLRRDVASAWTADNPILAAAEIGVEIDTLKFKIGDGVTAWNSLAYKSEAGPAGPAGASVLNGATDPTNGIGVNGDFYINTTTYVLFGPKASGAWPSGVPMRVPPLTADRALVSDGGGGVDVSTVTADELEELSGVTGNVQDQLDGKQSTIEPLTASRALISSGSGLVTPSSVTSTELGRLSGVTSGVQSQLDALTSDVAGKQPLDADLTAYAGLSSAGVVVRSGSGTATTRTITSSGGITTTNGDGIAGDPALTIADDALAPAKIAAQTVSRAAVYDTSGHLTSSAATAAEVAFLSGVTSAIQTQIDGKQPIDSDLTAIAGLSATGLVARTGSGTASARTITGTASQITVTNGDGVSGNPTISLPNSGVTAGAYTQPSAVTVDAQGRTTSITAGYEYPNDPRVMSPLFEEWISSTEVGALGWTTVTTGAGAGASTSGAGAEAFNLAQGTMTVTTGTSATGRAAVHLGATMGIGYTAITQKWRMLVSSLSTALEEFELVFGLGDTPTGAGTAQTNAVLFEYDRTVSTNWLCKTWKAGSSTVADSGHAVINTAYERFQIDINTAGTQALFYINGSLVCTVTTNIPGFVQFVGPFIKQAKSVGNTARTAIFDYFQQRIVWSTPR